MASARQEGGTMRWTGEMEDGHGWDGHGSYLPPAWVSRVCSPRHGIMRHSACLFHLPFRVSVPSPIFLDNRFSQTMHRTPTHPTIFSRPHPTLTRTPSSHTLARSCTHMHTCTLMHKLSHLCVCVCVLGGGEEACSENQYSPSTHPPSALPTPRAFPTPRSTHPLDVLNTVSILVI